MKTHEWQVTNLELSKRIKELGVKQESLWYWWEDCRKQTKLEDCVPNENIKRDLNPKYYSAFTVAELGEMLEYYTDYIHFMPNWKYHSWKVVLPRIAKIGELGEIARTVTEANARAKMLIYLKEKGFIK